MVQRSRSQFETHPSIPISTRVDVGVIQQLEGLAFIDGTKLAPQVQRAAEEYWEQRVSDPNFPQQVEAARTRINEIFDTLLAEHAQRVL
jgi:hypothetical protein